MSLNSARRAGQLDALGQLGAQVGDLAGRAARRCRRASTRRVTSAIAPSGETIGGATLTRSDRLAQRRRPPRVDLARR